MIFYSRENGRDGEKDYLDTNDFKDVYFEKESFNCLSEDADRVEINYKLEFDETKELILFVATANLGSQTISKVYEIAEPYLLVEQGAEAYYNETMLDDIELIKTAKRQLVEEIRKEMTNRDIILTGVEMDIMGLVTNGGNTIATIDTITVNNRTSVTANRYYSILNLQTITAGEVTIFISDNTALIGTIDRINIEEDRAIITFSNIEINNVQAVEYVKPSNLQNREIYDENRVRFINVESSSEPEFDEFDDLF